MRAMALIFFLSAALAGVWQVKSRGTDGKAAPEPKRQTSERNWAKQALDRTAELKQQVAQQRREDGTR